MIADYAEGHQYVFMESTRKIVSNVMVVLFASMELVVPVAKDVEAVRFVATVEESMIV